MTRPVTFLSDYGLGDEFVGVVHGVIAGICPDARVIDITHGISPYDIRAAGLTLARSVQYLAPGVIMAVVDPGVGTKRRALCVDALAHLTGDPRTQAVFEIMFHRSELAGELAGIAERHDRDCRQARARVESVIARAVAAGELPRDTDTALAVEALYAYLTGLMHGWTLDPSSFDLRACAPALVDTFIAGLVANPPRVPQVPRAASRRDRLPVTG